MKDNIISFLEEHVEKMVLVTIGILCFWLFVRYVLISPNSVTYNDKTFTPNKIDSYIAKEAERLRDELSSKPNPITPYNPRANAFASLVESSITDVDFHTSFPLPSHRSFKLASKNRYNLPHVGGVNDISLEHIRAVAYVPKEEINEENLYGQGENEPNDIDFVTIEGKIDIEGLCQRFKDSFMGDDIPVEWRDPCLAKPVFAAVELQRQQLLADGSWGEWKNVPRSKIDHQKKLFEVIENVEELPTGGLKVRLLQFDNSQIAADLLQPVAYAIASAKEEWFPPSLHKDFLKYQKAIETQERLAASATAKEDREHKRTEARTERLRKVQSTKTRTEGGMGESKSDMMSGERGGGGRSSSLKAVKMMKERSEARRKQREKRKQEKRKLFKSKSKQDEKSLGGFYEQFESISINEKTNISKLHEPLIFWSYDDTVEPKESYRYRMRFGLFNPIAGTNQFVEKDNPLKNQVVLWSDFSEITESVEIPGRLYYFPREIQEAAKTVTVQVAKYVLGYWYSNDFKVELGEVIGEVVETKSITTEEEQQTQEELLVPTSIDYCTNAVLVDIVKVNDWSGRKNLSARTYFDMLYTMDGQHIERCSVKPSFWPDELRANFTRIAKAEKEPKEPLRDWGGKAADRRVGGDKSEEERAKEEMMMEEDY